MNDTMWHLMFEISKALIMPVLTVLIFFVKSMMESMKEMKTDIAEIKNNMIVHTEKVHNHDEDIIEMKADIKRFDKGILDFYRDYGGKLNALKDVDRHK